MVAVETFSIREAAERCGVSYQAMRKRVDRESVRVVKRDGVRRIPRSELERAGLWPGARQDDDEQVATLRSENERLRRELVQHRQLAERAEAAAQAEREGRERMEEAFHQTRIEKETSEQVSKQVHCELDEMRTELDEIASAGPIRALRLRRKLRAERAA
jgi:hypothetical protein